MKFRNARVCNEAYQTYPAAYQQQQQQQQPQPIQSQYSPPQTVYQSHYQTPPAPYYNQVPGNYAQIGTSPTTMHSLGQQHSQTLQQLLQQYHLQQQLQQPQQPQQTQLPQIPQLPQLPQIQPQQQPQPQHGIPHYSSSRHLLQNGQPQNDLQNNFDPYYSYQQQQQQLFAQQQQQQQYLRQQQQYQQQLLRQLYEHQPPPSGSALMHQNQHTPNLSQQQLNNNANSQFYTPEQYSNFLQKQQADVLRQQREQVQNQYREYSSSNKQIANGTPGFLGGSGSAIGAAVPYSPSTDVSNVRYTSGNLTYNF